MNSRNLFILVVIAIFLFVGLSSVFYVDERELAIKFRLGKVVRTDYKPGLYFKMPFVNNIRKFDSRILTLDARPAEYLTAEKKKVVVDFFAKWRINDIERFFRTMSGGDQRTASLRLYNIVNDGLKTEFSRRTVTEVVSGESTRTVAEKTSVLAKGSDKEDIRASIMKNITALANSQVEKFGIQLVDVRIKRIDFPPEISKDVYRRMESERARIAAEVRAQGSEEAEKIRANADRKKTILLAQAYREAQQTRGEGDAKSADIYAKAYTRDAEFYSFYRSLRAYRNALGKEGDLFVLEPDSEFFSYFKKMRPKR